MSINSTCYPKEATGNSEPSCRVLLQLLGGATLTADSVLLEAQITQFHTLREVRLSVSNDSGSATFPISFSGSKPYYRVNPMQVPVENLVLGPNTLTLTAESLGGSVASSQVTVTRVPGEGRAG